MMRPSLPLLALGLLLNTCLAAGAAEKVTVLLDWFVNPDHAPLVIAAQGGYFERAGLDVEMIAPADPSAPPRLVAAGKADIAITYQPDFMLQIEAGLPLVRFGTLVETPLNALIALKSGPIASLEDLKGMRVGYSVASIQQAYLNTMLASVGLSADDVTLINVNFNLVTALMSGQVDAVIDGYRNFELTQLEIEGRPGIVFFPEEHGVPAYDELIYVAHADRRDDKVLGKFLAAVEEATIFLTNHPVEAERLFMAAYPTLDDRLNREAFALTLPRFARRPAAMDPGRYDRFAEFLLDAGLITTVPEVDTYAVVPR